MDTMQHPLRVWRESILKVFQWPYLAGLEAAPKLSLLYFFEFVLFNTVKAYILEGGIVAAARSLCVSQ